MLWNLQWDVAGRLCLLIYDVRDWFQKKWTPCNMGHGTARTESSNPHRIPQLKSLCLQLNQNCDWIIPNIRCCKSSSKLALILSLSLCSGSEHAVWDVIAKTYLYYFSMIRNILPSLHYTYTRISLDSIEIAGTYWLRLYMSYTSWWN